MVDFGAGAWPLTGRDAEVGVALDALVAGRGVVLAGPPGVGKTRVAREVADRLTGLDPGTHVEWVTATSSGAGVPLAPFSHLVDAMGQIGTGLMVAQHWLGEFAAADGLARFAYDQGVAGDVAIQRGVGAFHLGLSALWRGRVVEADGWFAAAVTDLGPADLGFLPSAVDNWRATRALLGGRADADEPGSRLPLYETERLRLGAVVAAARGDRPTARRGACDAALTAERLGAVTYALFGWFDLARYGDPAAAAPRLAALVGRVESPVAPLLSAAVDALVAGTGAGLDDAASGLAAAGFDLWAAEWSVAAALAHRRAGSTARACGAAERASRLAAVCGEPRTPLLASLVELDGAALTPRERDVAGLAATGGSNAAIARQLDVSVRTVETHLQRAFLKLGVHGRDELSVALGLAAAPEAAGRRGST